MSNIYKRSLITIIIVFLFSLCVGQNDKPSEMAISNNDRCFVFSSMDWYTKIVAYDQGKNVIWKMNVKTEARKNQSQLIFETFDFIYDDYAYFVFKSINETKYVRFNPKTQEQKYITKEEFENAQ